MGLATSISNKEAPVTEDIGPSAAAPRGFRDKYPVPSRLPGPVASVHEALTGPDGLSDRWDWGKFRKEADGSYVIPGKGDTKSLKILSPAAVDAMRKKGVGASTGVMIEIGPPESYPTIEKYQQTFERSGAEFLKPIGPEERKLLYQSLVVHELEHANGTKPAEGSEFDAYKAQLEFLAKRGIIKPPSLATALRPVVAYYPEGYAMALLDAFDGALTPELREMAPGGKKFIEQMRADIAALKNPADAGFMAEAVRKDWLGTEYGRKFMAEVKDYYYFKFLEEQEKKGIPVEKALETADAVAAKKTAEFREFITRPESGT